MAAKDRENLIIHYLNEHGYADVALLSEMLQVSDMTVRRDLDKLEEKKMLTRVHGGASLASKKMFEYPLDMRVKTEKNEKYRLAQYAASLVEDGDAIAIDSSSTTYAMAPFLDKNITVITTNISTAVALSRYDHVRVILLGGLLRKSSMALTGKDVEVMMQNYCVDKAFLSSKAVDIALGATDATIEEGDTKKVMMQASKQVFFLYDHAKLNASAFYRVAPLPQMQNMIVDAEKNLSKAHHRFLEECRKNSVQVLHAEKEGANK